MNGWFADTSRMYHVGEPATRHLGDGGTEMTRDDSLSAQWEPMVAASGAGFEVLTSWPDGDCLPIVGGVAAGS